MRGLAEIELPRLAVVVGEALGTNAAFLACFSYRSAMKAFGRRFAWRVLRQGVGLIRNTARRLRHLHVSVALLVGERALRCVDRDLVEIGRTQARKLRVVIGEQTALQQWVVREVDAWHNMRDSRQPVRSRRINWPASDPAPCGRLLARAPVLRESAW